MENSGNIKINTYFNIIFNININTNRLLQQFGADVAGMSVCHETVVGVHCGLKVIALALVTNKC